MINHIDNSNPFNSMTTNSLALNAKKTETITELAQIIQRSNFFTNGTDTAEFSEEGLARAKEALQAKFPLMSASEIEAYTEEFNDYIEKGKSVEKPFEDIDDIHWGILLEFGEALGLTGDKAAIVASLNHSDIMDFHHEFIEKTIDGMDRLFPDMHKYSSTDEFWTAKFLTDQNGNFIKGGDGKYIHDSEFRMQYLNEELAKNNRQGIITPLTNSTFEAHKATPGRGYKAGQSIEDFSILRMNPIGLIGMTQGIKDKKPFESTYSGNFYGGGLERTWNEMLTNKNDTTQLIGQYISAKAQAEWFYKNNQSWGTIEEQQQKILERYMIIKNDGETSI